MLKNLNIHHTGLFLGLIFFVIVLLIPTPRGMEPAAWRTTAATLLIVTWWMTEAIPIPATSLLPIVLFPVLGISSIENTCSPYANPIVLLFLGGFIVATAMQTWNLHKRIALRIILFAGTKPS